MSSSRCEIARDGTSHCKIGRSEDFYEFGSSYGMERDRSTKSVSDGSDEVERLKY